MDNSKDKEELKNETNLSFSKDKPDERPEPKSKLDALSESQEDLEAVPADIDKDDHDNVYQDLRGNKANGYMKDDVEVDGSRVEEEIGKISQEEERKAGTNNTDRRNSSQQHGESGMPHENGNIDSPNSAARLAKDRKPHSRGEGTDKSLNSKRDSKDDLGWNEENKSKPSQSEDEKNYEEERSLLDPDNDNNIYAKEMSKNNDEDDRDMRRSSTKPERPPNSRDKDKDSSKSKSSEEEDKPKEMSPFQKKVNAFLESWQWGVFMTIITIYTLFFDDIRV